MQCPIQTQQCKLTHCKALHCIIAGDGSQMLTYGARGIRNWSHCTVLHKTLLHSIVQDLHCIESHFIIQDFHCIQESIRNCIEQDPIVSHPMNVYTLQSTQSYNKTLRHCRALKPSIRNRSHCTALNKTLLHCTESYTTHIALHCSLH